jgi:hypothetical protein
MVDFGTAAHGDYFSITDTYDPVSNRRVLYDTSHLLPAAMLEIYVETWPTPGIEAFRYMLRSGMMGWLTIMIDTSLWSAEQHAEAKGRNQSLQNEIAVVRQRRRSVRYLAKTGWHSIGWHRILGSATPSWRGFCISRHYTRVQPSFRSKRPQTRETLRPALP